MKSRLISALILMGFIVGATFGLPVFAADESLMIIDVRTSEEYAESHVKGAINIDVLQPDFQNRISKLDKAKTFKLYCRSGGRAGKALGIMNSSGFKKVENLGGLSEAAKKLNQPCEGKGSC